MKNSISFYSQKTYFNKIVLCFYFVFMLAVFAGIRAFGRGADYIGYLRIFGNYIYGREKTDVFYVILRKLNDFFFNSSLISIYFINTMLALSIKLVAFKNLSKTYSNFLLCLVFHFFTFYFLHDYTQIRASLAIAIFLWSLKDVAAGNFSVYLLKTVLASCCHISAITMIPFYIFSKIFRKNSSVVFIVIVGFLIAISAVQFGLFENIRQLITGLLHFSKLQKGIDGTITMQAYNLKYLALLGLFVIFVFIVDKKDKIGCVLYKSLGFGLCFYYYLIPVGFYIMAVRFAEFYVCVFIVLLANSVKNIKLKEKIIIYFLFLIFVLFYSYATIKTIGILS